MKKPKGVRIIAEVGSTHDGSFGNACKLIELAANLGADVVKFQTHIAEAETLRSAPSPHYFRTEDRFSYFKRTSFTEDQYRQMIRLADQLGIEFLSSPFSLEAVDLLEKVGVISYKIPSGEVTNLPLLEKVASTQKQVFLSSGMSDWSEIDEAVKVLQTGGPLCIMQCSSEYPCKPQSVGWNVLTEMSTRYNTEIGFSDHTLGMAASIGAIALGATVIEKHLTFSKKMYGSDAMHSMEPHEFGIFVREIRDAFEMKANEIDKSDSSPYSEIKKIFEKSIVSARNLPAGEVISMADLAFKKPGTGIKAFNYKKIIGKKIKIPVEADHIFCWEDFN